MLQDRESKQEAEQAAALASAVADAIARFARIKAALGTVSEPTDIEMARWKETKVDLPLSASALDTLIDGGAGDASVSKAEGAGTGTTESVSLLAAWQHVLGEVDTTSELAAKARSGEPADQEVFVKSVPSLAERVGALQ